MRRIDRLPLGLIPRAASLLARAFASDPILTLFLDDPARRAKAFPAFFRALLCEVWEAGHIYAAHEAGRFVGVAVWIPPSGAQPSAAFERRAHRNHAVVKSLFGGRAEAMYRGFANTARLHPKQPHWYLFFIGIHPAFQGRGIGRCLLEPVLRRADRERVLCYLETPFAATHEFYRRLGFRLRPGTFPFEGAPTLWTMVRKPAGAAS